MVMGEGSLFIGITSLQGYLVELGETSDIFTSPSDERTQAYITGRIG